MNFMAEDLAHSHPELLEAMREEKPASDKKLPDKRPSMSFDAFITDNPKLDPRGEALGYATRASPHFIVNDEGKLQLHNIGHGPMHDRSRQHIQVVPSTSPLPGDKHDNSAIHEGLPNRFDFVPRSVPDLDLPPVEQAVPLEMQENGPLPQTFSPQEKDYSHLPPAYREAARLADEQKNASEPMDIAFQLLKEVTM